MKSYWDRKGELNTLLLPVAFAARGCLMPVAFASKSCLMSLSGPGKAEGKASPVPQKILRENHLHIGSYYGKEIKIQFRIKNVFNINKSKFIVK